MVKHIQQTLPASFTRKTNSVDAQITKSADFPAELESADPEMTSSMAIHKLHRFIKKNKIIDFSIIQKKTTQKLRFCRECDKFNRLETIKTCYVCEDNYHLSCHKDFQMVDKGKLICFECQNVKNPLENCKVCNQSLVKKSKKATCQQCQTIYHSQCMSSDAKICKRCQKVKKLIPQKPKNKIKKEQIIKQTNKNLRDMFEHLRQKNKSLLFDQQINVIRKGRLFKAMNLLDDKPGKIKKYKNQLLKAIKAKQMNYTQDLKDIEFHFHHMKEGNMNFGLEDMSPKEEQEYFKYKKQPIGPFKMEYSELKGYGVVADMNIAKGSIICEYVGEVVTLRECSELDSHYGKNDSQMDLWQGRNSDEKLIIRPQKWTNIARFINGAKDHRTDLNVLSIRVRIRGVPAVLLIARRDIKKGQSLCYDYNAGGIEAKYDTSKFVE